MFSFIYLFYIFCLDQENEYIFEYILFSICFLQLIILLSFFFNAGDDIKTVIYGFSII